MYFNLHYFPLSQAIRMPALIFWRTKLATMKGEIMMDTPIRRGVLKVGEHGLGIIDPHYSRTIWAVQGKLVIKGQANIGRGSKIGIGQDATLTLGKNFTITGSSEIVCQKEITFGNNCLLSWGILIMDTDFHHILNSEGQTINPPKPVTIGNHVWIGCRNTILKGVKIADNNIISANSTITREISESNCIVGGHGKHAEIIKREVNWEM